MTETKFPAIDDVLGNIIEPEPSDVTDNATGVSDTPTKKEKRETIPEMLLRRSKTLPQRYGKRDPKVAIGQMIVDTLSLCDLGDMSMCRIINAMLLDYIETHRPELQALSRKTLL